MLSGRRWPGHPMDCGAKQLNPGLCRSPTVTAQPPVPEILIILVRPKASKAAIVLAAPSVSVVLFWLRLAGPAPGESFTRYGIGFFPYSAGWAPRGERPFRESANLALELRLWG